MLLSPDEGAGAGGGQAQGQQGQEGAGQGGAGQQGTSQTQTQTATKPELLEDRFWNPEKNSVRWEELNGEIGVLRNLKAETDVKLQGVPQEPSGYKLSLDGFEMPEGIEFTLDETNAIVAPVRAWAHKYQLPQEAFNDLVKIEAQRNVDQVKAFNAEVGKEREKLGANSAARIEAVSTALKGRIGDRGGALIAGMITAEQIEAYEALLRTTSAPGPGATGQLGTKPDYAKMSPIERLHYAHEKAKPKAA